MRFLDPLLLGGMALAALPIIIHLINRKRAVRRPFPAIEFLLRSRKLMARRLKLKQLLLLLLRVLLFILLPLAMARPYVLSDRGTTADERLPTQVVFVLDDSFSMNHATDGTSAFEMALEQLIDEVESLRPWDQAALVLAHSPPVALIPNLSEDHGSLRDAVEALSVESNLGTDVPAALELAREIHRTGSLPSRRTLLFTDNTQAAWLETSTRPADLDLLGELVVVETRSGEDLGNVAIVDAGYEAASSGREDDIDIWADVVNHGVAPRVGVQVSLSVDDELAGIAVVDLDPSEIQRVSFSVELGHSGLRRAHVSLRVEGPDVEVDNHRYISVHLDREVNALLINGDPRPVAHRDELFYLERALLTDREVAAEIRATIRTVEGLNVPFEEFDVVVLANVASLPRARIAELTQFVSAGGGLLFTLGDQIDPRTYNDLFGELLPKPLRSVRRLCDRRDPDANLLSTRIARLESSHPVFRVFDLPGGESIQSVSVYSYMLLEPSTVGTSQTLISYGDGGPALVQQELGAGRVGLLTTSIDRDWTDLPIRTAFLPMMRRLVRYLARRGASERSTGAIVGERHVIDVESQRPDRVTVIDPAGNRFVLTPEEPNPGRVMLDPEVPGQYEVILQIAGHDRRFAELMFSANLELSEMDLTPIDPSIPEAYAVSASGEADTGAGGLADVPERRVSLWPWMLFGAIILLYLESGLAARRRSWTRMGERIGRWRRAA
jgi:hypothetical protein